MAAREAAETMGRGLRQSVSASGGHVPVKAAKTLQQRLLPDDVHPADAVDVVHALSRLIEDEELRYEALVGDNGGSHRAGYAIGRILSVVQDDVSGVDVVSKFCLDALTSPSASAKTQAAGLRLLCSVVSVTGFQFPLTDERLIDRLTAWALGPMQTHADAAPRTARREAFEAAETAEAAAVDAERENAPTAGLARQAANTANLEALRVKTYAMGCLAVALEAEDVASALVRDGVMGEIMTPLRSFLVDNEPAEGVSVVEAAAKQGTDGGESGGTVTQDARTAAHYDALLNTDDAEDVGTAGAALADFSVKRGAGDAWLLPGRLLAARLRALAATGEYIECFGQALQGGAVDVGMALVTGKYWNPESNANANKGWPPETARRRVLTGNPGNGHQNPNDSEKCVCAPQLPESLAAVCALLAHAKFAVTFVDRGGVAALLRVPRGPLSVDESYRCLFAVSQTPSAMERLLAPGRDTADTGPNVAKRCVNFVLAALDGGHEAARRHAALFLALSFPFPAVVDAFDAAGGLRPLLNLLRHAAQLSSTASPSAKQTACHACHALRQYCRAHLHRRVNGTGSGSPGYRPVDLSLAATDRNVRLASHDVKTASVMERGNGWLPMDAFIAQGGHEIVLALMSVAAGDRHFHECVPAGLGALRIATLHPAARAATTSVSVVTPGNTSLSAADVLLEIAARAAGAQDAEAAIDALQVICQLVAPPPALAAKDASAVAQKKERTRVSMTPKKPSRRGSAVGGTANAYVSRVEAFGGVEETAFDKLLKPGRASLREAGGLRALLSMLTKGSKKLISPHDDAARALCCNALLAMARDPAIAQTLRTLQVARRLTDLVSGHKHKRGEVGKTVSTNETQAGGGSAAQETDMSTSIEAKSGEFHRAAVELIALTAGGAARGSHALAAANAVAVAPLRRMERHAIAAATRVQFPHEDLLRLIHEHLSNAGLARTADALAVEVAESGMLGAGNLLSLGNRGPGGRRDRKNEKNTSPKTPVTVSKRAGYFARAPGTSVVGLFGGTSTPRPGAFNLGLQTPMPGKTSTQTREKALSAGKRTPCKQTPHTQTPRRSKRKAAALREGHVEERGNVTYDGTAKGLFFAGAESVSPCTAGRARARFSAPGNGLGMASNVDTEPVPCVFIDDDREGCGVRSKLDQVMTTYLRAQHRGCATPAAACAPFSLLEPHACVEPKHPLGAPANVTKRVHRREWFGGGGVGRGGGGGVPRGGTGGKTRDRHFVFGRFRPTRALRDEGATFTCSSFFGPEGDKILSGANDGTLRLFDVNTGVVAAYVDEYRHSGSVRQIQTASAFGSTEKPFALSSSASETFLWDLSTTPDFSSEGPVATFEGACSASFDSQCARVFHAGGNTPGTACLYDITAGKHVRNFFTWNLMDQALGVVTNPAGASRRFTTRTSTSQRFADTSFGPNGSSLVLWGHTLWDVRLPHPIKTFDSFSDGGGVSFHPRGDEVVLNGEVWDLRSDRLLRCVSSLDGCSLSWTKTWDVAVASYRPPRDENIVQSSRRTKHPLRNAFRTVDCASDDFSDIATIDIDRNILHVSWDKGTDSKCCVSECDPNDVSFDSVVRVYEAGRVRPTEEDSDAEDEGDEGDEGLDEGVDLHLNDDEFRAMDEMNVLDEDDEQRAARTAAAIAGNGAALAGLRALLGGMVADRIRDAVIGQGADVDEDEDELDTDDDVEFSLEPENDADDGDDNDSVNDEDSEVSESESESVLLSLSSSGDETGDSVEELEGESSDDDESEGGF